MHIKLSPQRRDDSLTVSKQGDTLTINGTAYEFTGVSEGATLPASATGCEYIASDIERISGVLRLTLLLPHGQNPSQAVCFPEPLINPADGPLELPA
jgi:hypothetical protein